MLSSTRALFARKKATSVVPQVVQPQKMLPKPYLEKFCKFLAAEYAICSSPETASARGKKAIAVFPRWVEASHEVGGSDQFMKALTQSVSFSFDRTFPADYGMEPTAFLQLSDMIEAAQVITVDVHSRGNAFGPLDTVKTPEEQFAWRVACSKLPFASVDELYLAARKPSQSALAKTSFNVTQRRLFDHMVACEFRKAKVNFSQITQLAAACDEDLALVTKPHCADTPDFEFPRIVFVYVPKADSFLKSLEKVGNRLGCPTEHYQQFLASCFVNKKSVFANDVLTVPVIEGVWDEKLSASLKAQSQPAMKALYNCIEAQRFKKKMSAVNLNCALDDIMEGMTDILAKQEARLAITSNKASFLADKAEVLSSEVKKEKVAAPSSPSGKVPALPALPKGLLTSTLKPKSATKRRNDVVRAVTVVKKARSISAVPPQKDAAAPSNEQFDAPELFLAIDSIIAAQKEAKQVTAGQ